jgi:glycosyltransferase involved in cell wall biosynthesis
VADLTRSDRPIAIIAPSYGVPGGGVERYVDRLAVGLAEKGIKVEVVTPDPSHTAPRLEVRDGVTIHRFATWGKAGSPIPSPTMIRWLLANANRFALLNAHNLHTWIPALTAVAARRTGTPFVLTGYWHGTGHTQIRRLLHVIYRPIAVWTVRSAATVICNSFAERQLVTRDFGSRTRARVIPIGIDVPGSPAPPDQTRSPAPDGNSTGFTILSVGRLEHYKGTERAVRALRHLPPSYRLVVVGAGPAHDSIAAAAEEEGVADRVVMRGRCSDEELRAWYGHAAACISLSEQESFGLVVLEAASAGCPFVASDIDAHRELAAYVPSGRIHLIQREASPAQIASAVETAARAGRSTSSRDPADGWHLPSWETLVTEVLQVYAAVAK